jgi:hypothetical protein
MRRSTVLSLPLQLVLPGEANRLGLEEVTVCDGHKVLMEVNIDSTLIVGDPQGIFGQQLRPRLAHCLNMIFNKSLNFYQSDTG